MVNLRVNEQKTLSFLQKLDGKASLRKIASESKYSEAAVMRAALALKEKGYIEIYVKPETIIKLNSEGRLHAQRGLTDNIDSLCNSFRLLLLYKLKCCIRILN